MEVSKLKIFFVIASLLFAFHPAVADETVDYNTRIAKQATERTATLYLESTTKRIRGPIFNLKIMVDPGDQAINAVGVKLNYPPDILKAENIDIKNSFCELFIDKDFDNTNGIININCGKPYPGINQVSEIGNIKFSLKQSGLAKINFSDESMVLANDGFGTDVLESTSGKTLLFK